MADSVSLLRGDCRIAMVIRAIYEYGGFTRFEPFVVEGGGEGVLDERLSFKSSSLSMSSTSSWRTLPSFSFWAAFGTPPSSASVVAAERSPLLPTPGRSAVAGESISEDTSFKSGVGQKPSTSMGSSASSLSRLSTSDVDKFRGGEEGEGVVVLSTGQSLLLLLFLLLFLLWK